MENTNKMNRLTNDMKAFEHLMKEKRTKEAQACMGVYSMVPLSLKECTP